MPFRRQADSPRRIRCGNLPHPSRKWPTPVRSPFHWVLVLDLGGILVGLVIPDSSRALRRHSTAGARKRYAGLVEEDGRTEVIFVGMESVRSDWTDLSKEFQKGLYERVFSGEPVEDFVREFVGRLRAGECDSLLVYRKALRKPLDQYTETTPPHVKAARLLPRLTGRRISYVMTTDGPQPLELRESPIDYDHYVEKQLEPVADALLIHLGTSFRAILGGERQMELF